MVRAYRGRVRTRMPAREAVLSSQGGGGDEGTRTPYLSDANAALSQMSYVPQTNEPLHVSSYGAAREWVNRVVFAYERWEEPRPMR